MSYDYQAELSKLLNFNGLGQIIRVNEIATDLIETAGAFTLEAISKHRLTGLQSWALQAALDYLCETKKLRKVGTASVSQHQVYMSYNQGS